MSASTAPGMRWNARVKDVGTLLSAAVDIAGEETKTGGECKTSCDGDSLLISLSSSNRNVMNSKLTPVRGVAGHFRAWPTPTQLPLEIRSPAEAARSRGTRRV